MDAMSEIIREGLRFRQRLTIPCYDTDAAFRLKPAAFMDLAQEIAYWAAEELGFGYDALQEHRTAWVLSRMHIHYESVPQWRDRVDLQTWHKGSDGLFFLRDFILRTPEGAPLVTATSSWLVLDVATRHLVRPEALIDLMHVDGAAGDAIAEPAPKLLMPKELSPEPAGEHVVAYSDVDIIGHTNNARYAVWAMDCLPYGLASGRPVRDVFINFNKETVPGETVTLSRICGEDACYVEGKVDGRSAFLVKFVFA